MIPRDRSNTYNIHTTTRYTKDIGKIIYTFRVYAIRLPI